MDSSKNKKQQESNSKKMLSGFNNRIIGKLPKKGAINRFIVRKRGSTINGKKQTELDKKLVYSLSKSRIPNLKQLKYLSKFLSTRERWTLRVSFLLLLLSSTFLAVNFYFTNLVVLPVVGGVYTEGLIGAPKYINPLYANVSDVDRDISYLIFSSLFKHDKSGKLTNDLALSYEISEDNKIYTIKVRNDAWWHNGDPVTVNDIVFTFNTLTDSEYKSPLRSSFQGVQINKVDEETIQFFLSEPYAAFLELLTFGIMPRNIWYQIPPETASLAEVNLKPIGSGLYKFKSLTKDKSGNIKEYYLARNNDYYKESSFIENLTFKFYPNFEEALSALNNQQIEGISYLPKEMKNNLTVPFSIEYHELNLPQLTAIFFNQEKNDSLKDKKVRQALAYAISKDDIVNNVLNGEARAIHSPILPDSFAYNKNIKIYKKDLIVAEQLLDESGWKNFTITEEAVAKSEEIKDETDDAVREMAKIVNLLGPGVWRRKDDKFLIISLTTVERGENAQVLTSVKESWEKIGIKTINNIVEASAIQDEVLKPRNFEGLFYGLIVGADPDMYSLWHSTQVAQGLNIANYSNTEVDQLLEDARITTDQEARREKYYKFQEIIAEDLPVIFLYSPTYTYVQTKKVKGFEVKTILYPHDRFANVNEWYIETGKRLEL